MQDLHKLAVWALAPWFWFVPEPDYVKMAYEYAFKSQVLPHIPGY